MMDPLNELAINVGLDPNTEDVARLARFSCQCRPGVGAEDGGGVYWCDYCSRPMLAATVGELAREFGGRTNDAEAGLVYQGGMRRLCRALQTVACKHGACVVGLADAC